MHNIKDIRKDFENFKDKLKNRNVDISLDNIISLDEENRKLIQEKEKFEMEKKTISKSKDQSLFEKSKELSLKIEEINKNQIKKCQKNNDGTDIVRATGKRLISPVPAKDLTIVFLVLGNYIIVRNRIFRSKSVKNFLMVLG